MIFPQLPPSYYSPGDHEILSRMEKFYTDSITVSQSYWGEAEIDTRFECGDQTLWNEVYGNLPANRRTQFNFNRIRRVVNMISGHQRQNRKSTIVVPVENGDEETADQFSKILMWIDQQENMLGTVSQAFHGALVTGLNLLQVWVDYRSDPISGNIKIDNCPYNSFLIDPFFKKQDLSDCNGIWKRTFLTRREALTLLPDKREEIENLPLAKNAKDGKFHFMPETYGCGNQELLTYDEFYYRDYRKQKMLVDTQTGESLEWKHEDEDALEKFLKIYPQITEIDQEVPTVKLAVVVQGKVLYDGPNPSGTDRYPFIPVFAYYNPSLSNFSYRIQGVVRGLRDSQYLYNRRQIISLDIFESQINSGWKYKENALVNPKDVFLTGQGRGLALKEEAQMTDVEQIVPPGIPASMMQMAEVLAREIQEISGVNDELIGSAVDDKAGILSMLRQGAGLTTLQILFDNLDFSQKILGKLLINVIQANFTPGKVKRIIEQEPTPQFYNKAFGKYDAAVEEGLNTTTQRQMQFAQLLHLKEAGVPIPDDVIINSATLQDKKSLIEAIEAQKQQAAQAEQMQMQSALREEEARANLADARAKADEGLAEERESRVLSNIGLAQERRMESIKDLEQAKLNKLKQISELEDIDMAKLHKLIEMMKMVNEDTAMTAGKVDAAASVTSGVDKQSVPNETVR